MEVHYIHANTCDKNKNSYGNNGGEGYPGFTFQDREKQLKILIVSSKSITHYFYKLIFREMGHTPSTVENPNIAIEMFEKYHKYGQAFDIVFTDYILPYMNGITLVRILQKIHSESIFVLFPCPLFFNSSVKEKYHSCGGFVQKKPIAAFREYKGIIQCVLHQKYQQMTPLHYHRAAPAV